MALSWGEQRRIKRQAGGDYLGCIVQAVKIVHDVAHFVSPLSSPKVNRLRPPIHLERSRRRVGEIGGCQLPDATRVQTRIRVTTVQCG